MNRMRNSALAVSCLVLLGSGCQMFKPSPGMDSLDNASSRTWTVTASFTSGPAETHEQAPESFFNFDNANSDAHPVLTQIVAISQEPRQMKCSLSLGELMILRQSAPGPLMLVIYDDGIAALSPEIKKVIEQELFKNPYNRQEYFRLLQVEQDAALTWTRQTLGRKE